MIPVALSIAGFDPSAGAGIAADLKTFAALGVYGMAAVTALTVQNTRGVFGLQVLEPDLVTAQIEAVTTDVSVRAAKVGMLGNAAVIEAVTTALDRHELAQVVVDPIFHASSGEPLLATEALDVLRRALIPRARLLTPNLPETAVLLGERVAQTEAEMRSQAKRLLDLGARAVLIKGGHAGGTESIDLLLDPTVELRLHAPRIRVKNTHGTGCTLSAAVTAGLAKGLPLPEAVAEAKAYVTAAIGAAERLDVGTGRGPLHHFHAWW